MKVKKLAANEKIAAYVERILVIENYEIAEPFSLPLFANAVPTLLFKTTKGTIGKNATSHLTLFGQTILPETISFTEDFTFIAYFFKPYSLHSIFRVPALELTDRPIDLNLLEPQKTIELQERLLNAVTTKNMVDLLDDYIFSLISGSKADNNIIKFASTTIAKNPSKDILIRVQKELHITERTFQRVFENHIGIAPNLYRRICQFDSAFQQLNHKNYHKLSDIAFENGYADQSHYIRAFKEFTNITPKEYLNFGSNIESV